MPLYTAVESDIAPVCGQLDLPTLGFAVTTGASRIDRYRAPGSVAQTITVAPSTKSSAFFMQSLNVGSQGASGVGEPGVAVWSSGNWTVRLNFNTANANLRWDDTYIYAIIAGCGSATLIGSLTGQATSLAIPGVKAHVVACSGYTGNENDTIYIVAAVRNTNALMNQITSITPNQTVNSAVVIPSRMGLIHAGNV